MKYFHDAEFVTGIVTERVHPRGPGSPGASKKITPISYAIVCEDGRQRYWTLKHDENYAKATVPWLIKNVYPWLPPKSDWVSLRKAADGLHSFFDGDRTIELYAYSNGGQIDLFIMRLLFEGSVPEWLPIRSFNLRNLAKIAGLSKGDFPSHSERQHEALFDALWAKALYKLIEERG